MVGITTGLVERLLAAYPNVIAGMKDSSGDWNNTRMFLDAFVRVGPTVGDRRGDSATGPAVRDYQETISKSQTASSKSQGSSKIQHPKGGETFDACRSSDVDNDGSFDVFVGSESFLLANMRNGGVGAISATANVNPAAIHKLYVEWKSADADDQQAKLNVVRDVFGEKYPMISALKQAIAIYANDPAWRMVRPPLVELTAEQAKTLTAELKTISFTMR